MAERMDDNRMGQPPLDRHEIDKTRTNTHADRTTDDTVDGNAVGGVSGVAAGAAIGAVTGGPIGAVIGAAAGGLAGVGVAQGIDMAVNPEEESNYWRDNYSTRQYAKADRSYDHYEPAYRYGWESYQQHNAKPFPEVEPHLERDWNARRGNSDLDWQDARPATHDAWARLEGRRRDMGNR